MRHPAQVAVIRRFLEGEGKRIIPDSRDRIETRRYGSEARFQSETRTLFRRLPLIVGRVSDLPTGRSFFTHDHHGVPIVVTRDDEGRLRAMFNVCQHRGSRLVTTERGEAKSFVCGFHAWTYSRAGALQHVPHGEYFPTMDRKDCGLVPVPVESRHGFIWVAPSPGAPLDVATWLGAFDEDLTAIGLSDFVTFRRSAGRRAANWKLLVDVSIEYYHLKFLHAKSFAQEFAPGLVPVVYDWSGPNFRGVFLRSPFQELEAMVARPSEQWNLAAVAGSTYLLFPNTVMNLKTMANRFDPRGPEIRIAFVLTVWPVRPDALDYSMTMLLSRPPADEREDLFLAHGFAYVVQTFHEDFEIVEGIQRSLAADVTPVFRMATLERSIARFHDAIDRVLADAESTAPGTL